MLLQTYCVSIWPQQQREATKKKKKKRKKQDGEMGLQATVWDHVGPEDIAFTCIHCP